MKQRATAFYNMKAPEGYLFMVILPNYYGKGETPSRALHVTEEFGARLEKGMKGALYLVDPKARVNEIGTSIEYPTGGKKSIEIGELIFD